MAAVTSAPLVYPGNARVAAVGAVAVLVVHQPLAVLAEVVLESVEAAAAVQGLHGADVAVRGSGGLPNALSVTRAVRGWRRRSWIVLGHYLLLFPRRDFGAYRMAGRTRRHPDGNTLSTRVVALSVRVSRTASRLFRVVTVHKGESLGWSVTPPR
jgi:hypothetical protein